MRGKKFRGGYHDFTIIKGGLDVFPRLVASEHHQEFNREKVASGVKALDSLLGGGLDRGTSTLIMGPAGSGKSSVAVQYVGAAASRGEWGAIFAFDESRGTLLSRSAAMACDLAPHLKSGKI